MATFGWLWWKILSSPGDDNPLGLLAAFACAIAAVPAFGLAAHLLRRELGWVWRIASTLVLLLLLIIAVIVLH